MFRLVTMGPVLLALGSWSCGDSHALDAGYDAPEVPLFVDCADDQAVITVDDAPGCQRVIIDVTTGAECDPLVGLRPEDVWAGGSVRLENPTSRTWEYFVEAPTTQDIVYGHILGDTVRGRGCGVCDTVEQPDATGSGGNIVVSQIRLVFPPQPVGLEPLVLHVCSPEGLDPELVYFP
jgi:hypothetical protein